jgi:thiol-disulfide isomerase/thioredoxin
MTTSMKKLFAVAPLLVALAACTPPSHPPATLKTGAWRATLALQGQQLPFNFEVISDKTGGVDAYLRNADERLLLDEITVANDSVDIALHIFDANIKARIVGDTLRGEFIKNYDKNSRVPFVAVHGLTHRFEKGKDPNNVPDFSGKYSVTFVNDADTTRAVGIFHQQGDSATGTFLTPTGDYRYLEGNVADGQLQLSTFDGNHAYIFRATKKEDGTLNGEYISGKTWKERWEAQKNEQAALPDPESLTFLKPGYEKIEFSFPDVNGKKISLNDEKYKNKVVILQMFGTWCPNCMDETKFLVPWYNENHPRGVEIIGLAYERKPDFEYASNRVRKMIAKYDVKYDFAIAGTNDKVKAAETLPMLNKVVAFPTTIFIGRDGKVKKIHTGYAGPGTGVYYEQGIQKFNETVNELLRENLTSSR